jgi:demethylmenaquinone methyltransferase/2-methoxy-6-polyprenyl-1,4-benzoquinol methylase
MSLGGTVVADHALAVERYREHAAGYDASCARTQPLRLETVAKLRLRPGDTVLDAGSGTGMSFPMLVPRVGSQGRVVGCELSPEMMALARGKVRTQGWDNVTLLEGAIEDAAIPDGLDAILCFYTHDVMRSETALESIFRRAKPGARVAVAGMKKFPWFMAPLNVYTYAKARPYMTTFEGLSAPWTLLERWLPDLERRPTQFGMGYIAWGRLG